MEFSVSPESSNLRAVNLLNDIRLNNGTIIPASEVTEIADNANDHGAAPQEAGPVHALEGQVGTHGWEEAEGHDDGNPDEPENVAKDAESTSQSPRPIMNRRGIEDLLMHKKEDG